MRAVVVVWLGASAAGAAVIALPDSGRRLASFSEAHGPSALDAAGIALALAGWVFFLRALLRRRRELAEVAGTRPGMLVTFSLGLGAGLVIASVAADWSLWWLVGAVVLLAGQLVAAWLPTGVDGVSGHASTTRTGGSRS